MMLLRCSLEKVSVIVSFNVDEETGQILAPPFEFDNNCFCKLATYPPVEFRQW